jgi:Flp pilus assembly protein TadG
MMEKLADMRTLISRLSRNEDGIAAIETAMILPFLLFMFVGMIDLTELISANRRLTQSAAVISDVITRSRTNIEKSTVVDTLKVVDMILKSGDKPTEASYSVRGFRKTGSTIAQVWKVSLGSCSTGFTPTSLDTLIVADTSKSPAENNDMIVAEVCRTFTPWVGTILGKKVLGTTSVNLSEVIKVRSRTSNLLTCYKTSTYTPANVCNETL